MALTFIKDAALFSVNLINITGTFVEQEFFRNTSDNTKVGEIVTFTDLGGGNGIIEYILVGTGTNQFANGDPITGDGSGAANINSSPVVIGFHHVHVIEVGLPDASITIQNLINQIRDYEEELSAMDHSKIANASGKQDLGGGVLVGITLELLDNWRIQFEPRQGPVIESVQVTGGNIVATNDYNNNPIKASPFTQVLVTSSSSATIAQLQIIDLVYRIESLRSNHSKFGKTIYWNPTNGSDEFTGESPETAVATFAAAQELAEDNVGDVIYALNSATASTYVEEKIIITKNGLGLRGAGRSFVFNDTTGVGPTITIQANNVSLSGFLIVHTGTDATSGIFIDGTNGPGGFANNVLIENIIMQNINGDGVVIENSQRSIIRNLSLNSAGGAGILLNDNTVGTLMDKLLIFQPNDACVHLAGIATNTIIRNTDLFSSSTDYGIRIGPNVIGVLLKANNFYASNALGDIIEEKGSQQVSIEQEIIDRPIEQIHFSVESLRQHHINFGNAIYWSPYAGDDLHNGLHPLKSVKSFRKAQELASNYDNTSIICLPDNPSGPTIITEPITLSKNYIFLRGSGRSVNLQAKADSGLLLHGSVTGTFSPGETITQSTSGATATLVVDFINDLEFHLEDIIGTFDTTNLVTGGTSGATTVPTATLNQPPQIIEITGTGCQLEGLRITSSISGKNGIVVNGGNFCELVDLWIDSPNIANAITINNSNNSIIRNNYINSNSKDAIIVKDNVSDLIIEKNVILRMELSGINLNGTNITGTNINQNDIHDSISARGIIVGPDCNYTKIKNDNFVSGNFLGNFLDLGSNTSIEEYSPKKPTEDIRHAVESLRISHAGFGKTIYYNPVNGDDIQNGSIPDEAVKSFRRAQEIAVDGNNDIIIAIADGSVDVDQAATSEEFVITKNNINLRGVGRSKFIISLKNDTGIIQYNGLSGNFQEGEVITQSPSGATAIIRYVFGNDNELHVENVTGTFVALQSITGTISGATASDSSGLVQNEQGILVQANGVEISGICVENTRVSTAGIFIDGATINSDRCLIENCCFDGNDSDGIILNKTSKTTIRNNKIENSTNSGIMLIDNNSSFDISNNFIAGNGESGIYVSGTGNNQGRIVKNDILNNNWGWRILNGNSNILVGKDNINLGNISGSSYNDGTNTNIETDNTAGIFV